MTFCTFCGYRLDVHKKVGRVWVIEIYKDGLLQEVYTCPNK
jgi:hypothetical protein